jgi:hypothetical protein
MGIGDRLEATTARATTITAVATEAAATRAATGAVVFAGTSFVHGDGAATEIGAVQLFNRACSARIFHFDKAEALGLAGHAVCDDVDGRHIAVLAECCTQVILCGLEREIANVDIFHDFTNSKPTNRRNELIQMSQWDQINLGEFLRFGADFKNGAVCTLNS